MKKTSVFLLLLSLYIGHSASVSAQCIGVVTSGVATFWNMVLAGAQQAAQEVGMTVYGRGAVGEDNVRGQRYIINQIIYKEKCQGLLLAPNSDTRLKEVQLLKQQGIPTVFVDRDVGGARVSVVKTNNSHAGVLAGQAMLKALNGKGNIAVLGLKKGTLATDARQTAFIDEVTKGGLKVKVIKYLGTRIGDARVRAIDILNSAENIEAIFTTNETTTVATILALQEMNKSGKIIHIGFDSHPLIIDSLINETLHGFVIQDPFQMGYQGALTLHKAMQGEQVNESITTNSIYVDKNNINNTAIKKALRAYLD